MGTIQNSINQTIATTGALAGVAKHVQSQNKELKLKKVEAERDLGIANNELEKNNFEQSTKMETDKDLTPEQRKELKGLKPGEDIDRYLEMKSDKALLDAAAASSEFNSELDKFNSGEQETAPDSKRLEMMKRALIESNDEITARKTLQANVKLQKEKLEALEGVR